MRVTLVNCGHPAHQTTPEAVVEELRTLRGWAEGLRDAGAEVTVVQGFTRDAAFVRNTVSYRFVAGRFMPRLRRWQIPRRLHREVVRCTPDVVHLNGMLYAAQAYDLRRRLPDTVAIVVQHHAARPQRGPWSVVERLGLGGADGFIFAGADTAAPWRESGAIRDEQPVFEIMEGSSRFRMRERAEARTRTGVEGDPVCLWTGNLDANKDPLTVLAGFEAALDDLPRARLFMAYRTTELLSHVQTQVAASPRLSAAVEMLGTVSYGDTEALYNSADIFLQGSHREGSGYALADAMACGVVPVVTDIPSFRFMTGAGAIGALWPPGDSDALRAALVRRGREPLPAQRRATRTFFNEHLAFDVVGRQALAAYREVLARRRR